MRTPGVVYGKEWAFDGLSRLYQPLDIIAEDVENE